jgi:predicted  nucleic acid-binding Zn-ribbon protein
MAKVTRLKPANERADAVLPPFDVTITMNISGERQIVIRAPSKDPAPRSRVRADLDALVDEAERQRAKYEMRFLSDQLEDKTAALDNVWRKRAAEAEAKHKDELVKIEAELVATEAKRAGVEQRVAAAWTARGKSGEAKLEGRDKNVHDALGRDIDAAGDRVKKLEAEHLQHMQTISGNIEKLSEEIAAIERLIEKHRELVG